MPLCQRPPSKAERLAADTVHGLSALLPQVQNQCDLPALSVQGQGALNRVQQKAWWFYLSCPETSSSKGVAKLVCLALSSGSPSDKKLVKKSAVYELAEQVGLTRGEADLLVKKASTSLLSPPCQCSGFL